MARKISQHDHNRIASLLRSGLSAYASAKDVGVSTPTATRVAREEGIDLNLKATKKAVEALKDYNKANRIELGNYLFSRIKDLAKSNDLTARDLKDLMLAFGIGTDKRKTEDGEATKVSEQRGGGLDLEGEFKKLDSQLRNDSGVRTEKPPAGLKV